MYEPYLAHYGVKGMKWGVRKARDDRATWRSMSRSERKANRDKPNSRYSKDDRNMDAAFVRESGVKRINRRMNKGQSHARAFLTETASQSAKSTLAGVAAVAAIGVASNPKILKDAGRVINNAAKMRVQDLINSAKAANYARQARNAIPRITNGINKTIKLKPWQYKVG